MKELSKRSQAVKINFIKKAGEIIRHEGTTSLTVRKLSEATGYHYAAMYHYFQSLDHLIAHVSLAFHEELNEKIRSNSNINSNPIDIYVGGMISVAEYGFNNPNAFLCIFVDSFGAIQRNDVMEIIKNSRLLNNKGIMLKNLASASNIGLQKVIAFDKAAMALVIGYVILRNSQRFIETMEDALKNLESMLQNLWNGGLVNEKNNSDRA